MSDESVDVKIARVEQNIFHQSATLSDLKLGMKHISDQMQPIITFIETTKVNDRLFKDAIEDLENLKGASNRVKGAFAVLSVVVPLWAGTASYVVNTAMAGVTIQKEVKHDQDKK